VGLHHSIVESTYLFAYVVVSEDMKEHYEKTDVDGLVKDTESKALLSNDLQGLAAYKARREREKQVNNVVDDVEELKTDIKEIKSLLQELINSKQHKTKRR